MGRRFAPVPIETTFKSSQRNESPAQQQQQQEQRLGPNPELTPEQSPRSPSPVNRELRPRRRFAPQLVESSRRSRRVGDEGPATRPTDKTDITPYTKHIYSSRPRASRKRGESAHDDSPHAFPPSRRETEDDGVLGYLLELASKEAERQIQEVALAAFPNSRAREGGVAHFYYHEGSESDHSPEGTPVTQHHAPHHGQARPRRQSSDHDLNWWQKHMQEHAEHVATQHRDEDVMSLDADLVKETDAELDEMDLSAPPDPLWTTNKRRTVEEHRDSMAELSEPIRSSLMPDAVARAPGVARSASRTSPRGVGGPFGRPFGGLAHKPEDPKVQRMRQIASPPMLGKDIAFRTCPSPKFTKLETDHAFAQHGREDEFRDTSGQGGLWRGYCFRTESEEGFLVPAERNAVPMISTPFPPATPGGARTSYFDAQPAAEDPRSAQSSSESSDGELSADRGAGAPPNKVKGLHLLHGLDERLRREKAAADKEDKIAHEFGDSFVTQVYNYLSLGYPATARAYDDELSKITRLSTAELGRDDEHKRAKGHMVDARIEGADADSDADADAYRCPRWHALKTYITEWARQHPDLDNLDPLAWGVRERRGSWGV